MSGYEILRPDISNKKDPVMAKIVAALDVAALWVATHPKTSLAIYTGSMILAVLVF